MDLDILKTLTETGNPLINLIAIIGFSLIIYEINLILKAKEKVNSHDIEIHHLKETIKEMKEQLYRLDNEHREHTRKKGGH